MPSSSNTAPSGFAMAPSNAIATVSLRGTLEEKLKAAADAGFGSVEIFENDLIGSALSPREVRALMGDLGIHCSLYQPFRDFEGMPGEMRARAMDRAERKFDLMGELGTDRILVCSNCSPHALGDRQRIVDDFRELGDRAAARGIRVVATNHFLPANLIEHTPFPKFTWPLITWLAWKDCTRLYRKAAALTTPTKRAARPCSSISKSARRDSHRISPVSGRRMRYSTSRAASRRGRPDTICNRAASSRSTSASNVAAG